MMPDNGRRCQAGRTAKEPPEIQQTRSKDLSPHVTRHPSMRGPDRWKQLSLFPFCSRVIICVFILPIISGFPHLPGLLADIRRDVSSPRPVDSPGSSIKRWDTGGPRDRRKGRPPKLPEIGMAPVGLLDLSSRCGDLASLYFLSLFLFFLSSSSRSGTTSRFRVFRKLSLEFAFDNLVKRGEPLL